MLMLYVLSKSLSADCVREKSLENFEKVSCKTWLASHGWHVPTAAYNLCSVLANLKMEEQKVDWQ